MPDEPTNQADVALGTEEAETPKVFTQEDVDKAVRDARTAVQADVGRQKAEADKALKAATAATERLARLQKQQDDAELEAARDEPDQLKALHTRQQLRQKDAELEQTREQLNEANTRLSELAAQEMEANKEKVSKDVATRLGVNLKTLAKLAKFTDGTVESIEDIAKTLTKESERESFKPDSNRSQGGGSQSITQVRKDYVEGRINAVQYGDKMKALGAQP